MNKADLIAYRSGWEAAAKIEREELRRMSIQTKWNKLISIYNLALGLGLVRVDPTEGEIYQKWAKLKEKAEIQGR